MISWIKSESNINNYGTMLSTTFVSFYTVILSL